MTHWIDSHNHLQSPHLGNAETLVTTMKAVGITRAVVNATRESDWDAVKTLADRYPDFVVPAYGIHPWQAHTVSLGWQERLCALLETQPHASLGECGLDCWVHEPSLEIQTSVFRDQLRIANEMDRPLSIHCVRAWHVLFEVFSECPPRGTFLMHSFAGSIEIARRLIPLGAYFSFSGHFLSPRRSSVLEMFKQLPRDRILVETDAQPKLLSHSLPAPKDHPANLPVIGEAFATALAVSPDELAEITRANTARCFGW